MPPCAIFIHPDGESRSGLTSEWSVAFPRLDVRGWAAHLRDMLLYHVTPTELVPQILAAGLVPQVGPRARKLFEPEPLIYLFRSAVEAEEALMNWLGDEFPAVPLTLLEIKLPPGLPYRRVAFEIQVAATIPPAALRIVRQWDD